MAVSTSVGFVCACFYVKKTLAEATRLCQQDRWHCTLSVTLSVDFNSLVANVPFFLRCPMCTILDACRTNFIFKSFHTRRLRHPFTACRSTMKWKRSLFLSFPQEVWALFFFFTLWEAVELLTVDEMMV